MHAPYDPRVPLQINTALERMNLPPVSEPAVALPEGAVRGQLLQDYRPLADSLEWHVARAHWNRHGLLPFADSQVPFLINNSGRLSADAAQVLFEHCREAEALPATFSVLEVGAGTGLFARYLLDRFRELCDQAGKDFYQRLTYVVTDCSPRTTAQWEERALLEGHPGRVRVCVFDPMKPDWPELSGPLRAVFCNYVLDVLPASVIRRGAGGIEELQVRTYLTPETQQLAGYTDRSADEIAALASSEPGDQLQELVPLLPLFELEAAFRPVPNGAIAYSEHLAAAAGDRMLLNHGALQTIARLVAAMPEDGFLMINDYGPVTPEQDASYCSLQRFGPTVAFGLNFPLVERHCARLGITVTRAEGDEQRGIHMRFLSRAPLPGTRTAVLESFSSASDAHHDAPLTEARAHVAAGRLHEALDAYREGLSRNPHNWHVLGEVGEFLALQLRSFEPALQLLGAAVALNPCYSAWLWNALGDALYCLDRFPDAHQAYLQAARIDPDDPRTNLNLAYTLAQFGQLPDALAAIARGLARDGQEAFRPRLLEKQAHVLALLSSRWQGEQQSLTRRAGRLQMG